MAKTEQQIADQAKAAVNRVIEAHRSIVLLKVQPDMRKAFPFGPKATEREKQVWNETVAAALQIMESWPVKVMVLLVVLALSVVPAHAQNNIDSTPVIEAAQPIPVQPEMVKKYKLIPAVKEDGSPVYIMKPKNKAERLLDATRLVIKHHPKIVRACMWAKNLFLTYCQVRAGIW